MPVDRYATCHHCGAAEVLAKDAPGIGLGGPSAELQAARELGWLIAAEPGEGDHTTVEWLLFDGHDCLASWAGERLAELMGHRGYGDVERAAPARAFVGEPDCGNPGCACRADLAPPDLAAPMCGAPQPVPDPYKGLLCTRTGHHDGPHSWAAEVSWEPQEGDGLTLMQRDEVERARNSFGDSEPQEGDGPTLMEPAEKWVERTRNSFGKVTVTFDSQ